MRVAPSHMSRNGFALIVTISMLVLLALVAVGLLSLSSISVRASGTDAAKLEAQANARLGLHIAMGELQRSLGPDRRVSATAGVLDETPGSLGIDGVKHPYWTAVWSTAWTDGRTPWQRDDKAGGLRDRRVNTSWDAGENVENYLVSGNEGGRDRNDHPTPWLDARTADLGDEAVTLLGEGSIEDPDHGVLD